MPSWFRRALAWIRPFVWPAHDLTPEERAHLEMARIEANRSRIAGVLPMLAFIEIAMLFVFRAKEGDPHAVFRHGVFTIHLVALPFVLLLLLVARIAPKRGRRLGWLGDGVLIFSMGLGLLLSLNTHRLSPNVNSLTTALFAGTLIVRPTLLGASFAYGGAVVGLILGVGAVQPDPELRVASLTSGITASLLAFAFSRVLDAAFVREVLQKLTIRRQKDELLAWNAELERRVAEQVKETLAHAEEARALDARLRWKVRERSRELANALRTAPSSTGVLASGTRFEHRFDIERHVGAGAMGDVYSARDAVSGQTVALKILRRAEGVGPADIERFVAEGAAAASVVHPAIVRTFDVDITETGHFFLVMELVPGRTLAAELRTGRFDAAQTARLGSVVADALSVAHRAGVVHRDIKPSNLMLTSGAPGVRILDFGVSKLSEWGVSSGTVAGQVVGTPQYMAPEQILGDTDPSGACDVYALGQVLYEMLTGEPCFSGKTVREVLRAQVSEAPMSIRSRAGTGVVPDDLAGLIGRCLEKAPQDRPRADVLAASLRVLADVLGAPPLMDLGPPRYPDASAGASDVGAPTLRA